MGESEQIPPKYSAIKVGGKKLYELARKGQDIGELKPRPIRIKNIELVDIDENKATIKVGCSKGTYVRSLIRDIAERLGTTAIMSGLTRTKSGAFEVLNSLEIGEFTQSDDLLNSIVDPIEVLDYPQIIIDEDDFLRVKNGGIINNPTDLNNETVLLIYDGNLASVAQATGKNLVQKKVLV